MSERIAKYGLFKPYQNSRVVLDENAGAQRRRGVLHHVQHAERNGLTEPIFTEPMDTDDIDNMLIRQLSCLGTSDKEVLVKQFQSILGDVSLSPELCAFFLDMSNWNLQDAVGAYYDHGHTNNVGEIGYDLPLLNMQLVRDVTVGEGESVPPKTRFVKSWRVKNNGGVHWPQGTALCFVEGTPLASEMRVPVASLGPGGEAELTVEMISPSVPGIYQSRWQLNTPQSVPFGEAIWCIIAVDSNGILDITQQLANAPLGRVSSPTGHNPFMRSSPDEMMADDFMGMDVTDRFSMHLSNFDCSSPVTIPHGDGTDGPPCTPCTPPHDERE